MAFNLTNLTSAASQQSKLQSVRRSYRTDELTDRVLDCFKAWCRRHHTDGTSDSYRSLVAKVAALEICFEKQTSSQRSAMAKFDKFVEAACSFLELDDSDELSNYVAELSQWVGLKP